MKKYLLTIVSIFLFVSTILSQSYIGAKEKDIIKDQKKQYGNKIDSITNEKFEDGSSNFTLYFYDGHLVTFTVNKDKYCIFMIYASYDVLEFDDMINYIDKKGYRKEIKIGDFHRWIEPKDGYFVIWKLRLFTDRYFLMIMPESIETEVDNLLKSQK